MLDVAPNRDLFVPFEAMLSDLLPAWYAVRTVVRVDGGRPQEFISRAFALEWPRSEIRRGSVQLDAAARAGGHSYLVERVELGADAATVFWRPQQTGGRGSASSRVGAEERAPAGTDEASGTDALTGGAAALLVADGQELETVPAHVAPPSRLHRPGEARTVSYPVARGVRSLAVVVRSGSGESSTPVDVPLP